MPPKVIGLNFKRLFQKNTNTWEREVEDKELPRVLKKEYGGRGEGGDQKKNHVEFPWVLVIGVGISKGCMQHNFAEYPGVKVYFLLNFQC